MRAHGSSGKRQRPHTPEAFGSYEEYHPYGTTAWHAANSAIQVSAKRYRYTGKEKDEETGLSYHGARYYAPWLGRWCSADPAGMVDGPNRYAYVRGNPVGGSDPTGRQSVDEVEGLPEVEFDPVHVTGGPHASDGPVAYADPNPSLSGWFRTNPPPTRIPGVLASGGADDPNQARWMEWQAGYQAFVESQGVDVAKPTLHILGLDVRSTAEGLLSTIQSTLGLNSEAASVAPLFAQVALLYASDAEAATVYLHDLQRQGETPQVREVAGHTLAALQSFEANPARANAHLTDTQLSAMAAKPALAKLHLGSALQAETNARLRAAGVNIYMTSGSAPVDYVVPGIDITGESARSVARHVARPEVEFLVTYVAEPTLYSRMADLAVRSSANARPTVVLPSRPMNTPRGRR